jgi:hypothetical protein
MAGRKKGGPLLHLGLAVVNICPQSPSQALRRATTVLLPTHCRKTRREVVAVQVPEEFLQGLLSGRAPAGFQPTLLKSGGKPKAAGGARKKISGGCG